MSAIGYFLPRKISAPITYYYPPASQMSSWPGPNGWHGPPRYMTPVGDPLRGYNQPALTSPPAWLSPPDPYHAVGSQLSTSHHIALKEVV